MSLKYEPSSEPLHISVLLPAISHSGSTRIEGNETFVFAPGLSPGQISLDSQLLIFFPAERAGRLLAHIAMGQMDRVLTAFSSHRELKPSTNWTRLVPMFGFVPELNRSVCPLGIRPRSLESEEPQTTRWTTKVSFPSIMRGT